MGQSLHLQSLIFDKTLSFHFLTYFSGKALESHFLLAVFGDEPIETFTDLTSISNSRSNSNFNWRLRIAHGNLNFSEAGIDGSS
jgi:hypothetical protein